MKKKNIIIILIIYMFFSFVNLKNTDVLTKQLFFYMLAFSFIILANKEFMRKYIRLFYIVGNLVLLYVLLFGNSINGSRAWLNIGFFSFQPSEFMKIILLIYLGYITTKYDKYKLKAFIITLIPSILTFLEPDTGNVIFYFVIYLSLIIYKEKNNKKILRFGLTTFVLLFLLLALYFFHSEYFLNIFGYQVYYRMERIVSLFDNSSYQLNRALMGIGSSGLFGNKNILSIPYQTTDFAFSYLASNLGLIGISLYLIFNLYVNLFLIREIHYQIGIDKNILFGFVSLKITQESIHMLMNIGLFPITGITLPFISYGGSSLLTYALILSYFSKGSYSMGIVDRELDYSKPVLV